MPDNPLEIKPSFFSISGFLIPGIVFVGSVTCLFIVRYYARFKEIVGGSPVDVVKDLGVAATVVILALLIAIAFVVGAILSEIFSVVRTCVLRPIMKRCRRKHLAAVFRESSLRRLVRRHANSLEAYVYVRTCGLDLDWYAGRIRMLGGSAIALMFAAVFSYFLQFEWLTTIGFMGVGLVAMLVAWFRSHRFDRYVADTAAVLLKSGGPKFESEQAQSPRINRKG